MAGMTTAGDHQRLSIIVPFHDEAAFLATIMERLRAAPLPVDREYILVDDGSSDGSSAVAEELAASSPEIRLVAHPQRRGKGAAVASGLGLVRADYVTVQDADLEYDPRDLAKLLEPLLAGEADAVYGNRFAFGRTPGQSAAHYAANRALTAASNALNGLGLSDAHTCYRVVRTDLLKAMPLRSQRFGFEIEVNARLGNVSGVRVLELPISYVPRSRAEGKKIGWRDGLATPIHLLRFNVFAREPRRYDGPRAAGAAPPPT
jgi:glycosyltransferase involved in cell wall biosynthesis